MRWAIGLSVWIGTVGAAMASDTGPTIVIPGRAGVPVIINGSDASFGVVEGDWGLGKGVHVQPVVYGGWDNYVAKRVGHYYPSAGRTPGYGRYEVEPPANRLLPPPAESYRRSWSTQSMQLPPDVPANPPPVIVAPQIDIGRRHHQH